MFISKRISQSETIKNLFYAFKVINKKSKKIFLLTIFLGLIAALLDGIVLISLSKVLGATSTSLKGSNVTSVLNYLLYPKFLISLFGKKYTIYICLGVYTTLLFLIRTYWLNYTCKAVARIAHEISQKAFDSVLWQDFSLCTKRVNSTIISDFSHINFATNGVILPLIDNVMSIGSVVTITFVILVNSKTIGGSILIILFIFYLSVLLIVRKKLKVLTNIYQKSKADLVNIQQIGIERFRNIILEGETSWLYNVFSNQSDKTTNISGKIIFFQRFPRIVIDLILFGSVVIILITSSILKLNINLGFFTFLVLALVRLIPPLQAVYRNTTNIRSNIFALDALINISKTKSKRLTKNDVPDSIPNSNILIKNIFYKFNDYDKNNILNGVNIPINKGEHTGIIGVSGSGKSTLLDIMAGFTKPTKGEIIVDGKNIYNSKRYNRKWLNSSFMVLQDDHIFNGSLLENILFGDSKVEFEKSHLEKIIKIAELDEVVGNLPQGLETRLGSGGYLLSGGQKQRVSIARALYKKRPFLFLDEATSALDSITEKKVLSNINEFLINTTIVSISHKKSSLKFCSQIWQLKNGTILRIK